MRAVRLNAWKSEANLEDVPRPEPDAGHVIVQVGGAGACHSDLHLIHDFEPGAVPWEPPFTLGHENAGWVQRGRRGRSVAVGTRRGRRRLGLRTLRPLPRRARDLLRAAGAAPVPGGGAGWVSTAVWRAAAGAGCAAPRPPPRRLDPQRRAAHRRRAHSLPRRTAVLGEAGPTARQWSSGQEGWTHGGADPESHHCRTGGRSGPSPGSANVGRGLGRRRRARTGPRSRRAAARARPWPRR